MSRGTNEGVIMHCKTITVNFLTIVRLLVGPITSLAKLKAYLEAYVSIRQPPWRLTSVKSVIYPSLSGFFYFGSKLINNRYWWSTVLSYVGNSADRCGGVNITVKMKFTKNRNCLYFPTFYRGGYFLLRGPSLRQKIFLKQSWEICLQNSLIRINLS